MRSKRQIARFDRKTCKNLFKDDADGFRKMIGQLRNAGFTRACKYRAIRDAPVISGSKDRGSVVRTDSYYGDIPIYKIRSDGYAGVFSHFIGSKRKNLVMLDAGCGKSPDAFVATNIDNFSKAYMVDILPFPSLYASLSSRKDKKGVIPVLWDICEKWSFVKDNSLDLVVCSAVLDCMDAPDRDLFYRNAYAKLRKGGLLSVSFIHLACGWGYSVMDEKKSALETGFDLVSTRATGGFVVQKI